MLLPSGDFHVWWDLTMLLLVTYVCAVSPFRMCFSALPSLAEMCLDAGLDLFFLADIAVTFATAIEDDDTRAVISEPRTVARRYLGSWFVVDVASSMPIALFELLQVSGRDSWERREGNRGGDRGGNRGGNR